MRLGGLDIAPSLLLPVKVSFLNTQNTKQLLIECRAYTSYSFPSSNFFVFLPLVVTLPHFVGIYTESECLRAINFETTDVLYFFLVRLVCAYIFDIKTAGARASYITHKP